MLTLQKIVLTHFKNYHTASFSFEDNVIGICGLNGKGKTNLLDAIYYSCFTKSYFSVSDSLNTQFDKEGFRIEANYIRFKDAQTIVCINRGNKKELYCNEVPYEKFSKHLGYLPVVMIAPDDIELVTGGSEKRRKFLDSVLSQLDQEYLQQLIIYNKIIIQRNGLLKNYYNQQDSNALLEILDIQLIKPAKIIYQKRTDFLKEFLPMVIKFYKKIAANEEMINIEYVSQLHNQEIEILLMNSIQKDILLQRSNSGIHKDDISFQLNGQIFKNVASQGQRKSLLFALKLAEYEMIKKLKGFSPLLLLDDVFEKLDDSRMNNLLDWVCNKNEGQVFITDTHRQRLVSAFELLGIKGQIIELK